MLKMMLCAALAITVATIASAAPKDRGGSAGDVYRFVGYATTTLRQGDEGFVAMHQSCQEDFGPLARMSTTEEFWLSPDAAFPDEGEAWVHPVGIRSGSFVDFTGAFATGTAANCAGWRGGASGATIGADGELPLQSHTLFLFVPMIMIAPTRRKMDFSVSGVVTGAILVAQLFSTVKS